MVSLLNEKIAEVNIRRQILNIWETLTVCTYSKRLENVEESRIVVVTHFEHLLGNHMLITIKNHNFLTKSVKVKSQSVRLTCKGKLKSIHSESNELVWFKIN